MFKRYRRVLMLLAGLALGGCYDDGTAVVVHEPGVYKGKSDPLLATNATARADQLKARFNGIQTDR